MRVSKTVRSKNRETPDGRCRSTAATGEEPAHLSPGVTKDCARVDGAYDDNRPGVAKLMTRSCSCSHGFPLCACAEGLTGDALLARSRRLSSVAGWPARVAPEDAAWVIATQLRPQVSRPAEVDHAEDTPSWLALEKIRPDVGDGGRGCGCGRA